MLDRAHTLWLQFAELARTDAKFNRYVKWLNEPQPLFELIGEDLESTDEQIRANAFWSLVVATPALTNILYERECVTPEWRNGRGTGQALVNRGMDIVTYLHHKLVSERKFKAKGASKDPRPYVYTAIRNWTMDEKRKWHREVPLEDQALDTAISETESTDVAALERVYYEECRREFVNLRFLNENECSLWETVYLRGWPRSEAAHNFGFKTEAALRKSEERARKKAVSVRDAVLTWLLIGDASFGRTGSLNSEIRSTWIHRARAHIEPGPWIEGFKGERYGKVLICHLTQSYKGAPGQLYLVAVDPFYANRVTPPHWHPGELSVRILTLYNLPESPCALRYLETNLTEIPSLNNALRQVPSDYQVCIVSSTLIEQVDHIAREIAAQDQAYDGNDYRDFYIPSGELLTDSCIMLGSLMRYYKNPQSAQSKNLFNVSISHRDSLSTRHK